MHPLRGTDIYSGPWRRLPPYSECREGSAPGALRAGSGLTSARSDEDARCYGRSLERGDPTKSESQSLKKWPSFVPTRLRWARRVSEVDVHRSDAQ